MKPYISKVPEVVVAGHEFTWAQAKVKKFRVRESKFVENSFFVPFFQRAD